MSSSGVLQYAERTRPPVSAWRKLSHQGTPNPRFALQTLGTEWGRCYENTWVDYGIRMAQKILAEGWRYTPQRGVFKESFFKRFMADRPIGVVFGHSFLQ